MPIFVKIEEGIVDKPKFDQHVPAHKVYVQGLIARGHKARTGYWAVRGGGMMIFEAASMAEAQAIIAEDPLVKNGCVNYQLYEWRIVME
ncbi:YCII-like protein [Calothrix sp. NIES-4101]|nr:YCII-like protein [Calothrix sp. NIES-4101]